MTNNYEQAKDAIVDGAESAAAGLGFSQREDRRSSRPSYQDRGDRRGDRGSAARGDRFGASDRREPLALAPNPVIYVGNLLFDVTAADLDREFGEYGQIIKSNVASDARGLSKG